MVAYFHLPFLFIQHGVSPHNINHQVMRMKNIFKVPITPKYFVCLNKSLHLFETHCAFLN